MMRLIVLGLVVLFCLPVAGYAASIGGAETQGQGRFALSVDTEFVFNRDLKWNGCSWAEGEDADLDIRNIKMDNLYRVMAKLSCGVLDCLDAYVKLGIADCKGEAGAYIEGVHACNITYKGKNAFAYGFGLKGVLDLENDWLIGADTQYVRHKNSYSGKLESVPPFTGEGTWTGKATVQEWHVAPYVAVKLENLVPYFGVKYSDMRLKTKEDDGDYEKYKADDKFGMFVGSDIKFTDNISANLEGRFIDETAMSFALAYKF